MLVVAVLSEKGGAGKSTLTTHLAVCARLARLDVVICDLDPQASAADWCEGRTDRLEAVAVPPGRLERTLSAFASHNVQVALIDTGKDAGNTGYVAAKAADVILVPVQAGGFDLRALTRTVDVIRTAGKERQAYLVPSRIPTRGKVQLQAREALAQHGLQVCPVTIYDRAAYRTASVTMLTPMESDPASVAAQEMQALFDWVRGQSI